MTASIRPVPESQAGGLANLMELYCHDLSPYFPIEIGNDGRFGYPHLPRYFQEPESRFAYFIEVTDGLAGFILATRGSPASDDPAHLDVAEFFVLRQHRRHGVGEQAAFLLWDSIPGHWLVRVATANRAAVQFWHRVVTRYTEREAQPRSLRDRVDRLVFELDSRSLPP